MAGEILGDGNSSGTGVVASTSELLHLYGGTAVAQPSGSTQAAVTATALGTISFTSATAAATVVAQVNALTVLVNKLRTDLVALGAIKGSA